MAEELAHDANEELDGTTTDSPVTGFSSSLTSGPTLPTVISTGLSCPSSPNLPSPISPSGACIDDVDTTLSPHDFIYEIPFDDCSSPTLSHNNISLPSPPIEVSYSSNLCADVSALSSDASIDVTKIDDIGFLLRSMPQHSIRTLPSKLKYSLSINHFRPKGSFKFPRKYVDGCNRSCRHPYFVNNPWFVYSKVEDGIFCLPCVLFASGHDMGQFVCRKFDNWSRKTRKFAQHNERGYHKLALVRMEALKASITNPTTSIDNSLRNIAEADIAKNRYIIKCVAEAILFCGKQCLALRGH